MKLAGAAFEPFLAANPEFDIRHADLFDSRSVAALRWAGSRQTETLEQLRTLQRLLRVHPSQSIAERLIKRGYVSAHHIANDAEHQFVRDQADLFGGDAEAARQVHRRAVHITQGLRHVHAWVRDALASPHFRSIPAARQDDRTASYFRDSTPSYQTLFGGLDYLQCEECESILGPAAYFLDLMRVTDQYITDPNLKPTRTIPPHYALEERRSDLFELDLTCENTNTVLPYLSVVNGILEEKVRKLADVKDAYKLLAVEPYPNNLPFNLPREEARANLAKVQLALPEAFRALEASDTARGVQPRDRAREQLGLSVEDLEILITPDPSPAAIARRYGYAPSDRLLSFPGDGRVTAAATKVVLTGQGTRFLAQVKPRDSVRVGQETRTVTAVTSDTVLQVGTPWSQPADGQPFTVLPAEGIFWSAHLQARTRLTPDALREVLTEQLDHEEVSGGVAGQLFINATGESLPPLREIYDPSDPDSPSMRVVELSYQRLDRLDRFIRLQRALGWAAADVDWAIREAGNEASREITRELITRLATMERLRTLTGLPADRLFGLWSNLKTIGRVDRRQPRDVFDRVFNNPALLGGADPYRAGSTVPFNPMRQPPQEWTVAGKGADDRTIRGRLAAALAINDGDLTTLAQFVLRLQGKKKILALDLPTLSALHRLATLASLSKLGVQGLLALSCLIYYPDQPYLEPPAGAIPVTLEAADRILDLAGWIDRSGLDIFQLQYALTDDGSPFFEPAYEEDDLPAFVKSLAASAKPLRLGPSSFALDDLTAEESEALFDALVTREVLTSIGIVRSAAADLDPAELFPLRETAFESKKISARESAQAFAALAAHQPPLIRKTVPGEGVLTADFTADTSLDFLESVFKGKHAKAQISEVRAVLLRTRRHADQVAQVLEEAEDAQRGALTEGLASLLDLEQDLVGAVLPIAQDFSGLEDDLPAFLTPPKKGALPEEVAPFVEAVSRYGGLAKALKLGPTEVTAVIDGPAHFNVADPMRWTLDEVHTLSDYRLLVDAWRVRKDALLEYFSLPRDEECPGPKAKLLAKITGWDPDQICELIKYFWPPVKKGAPSPADEGTVRGLVRMKGAFDAARLLRADITGLVGLTAIAGLPLRKPDGSFDDAAWETYQRVAARTLDMLSARFGAEEFGPAHRAVVDELNAARRDRLLAYTLWRIRTPLPEITSADQLYQYLLIDVQMGACMDTSKIAQGIASVQLYMQRARMMLEPGVTDLRAKQVWWVWLTSYRVWEANRKVFLYPENYLDPTLRSTATPQFKELADELSRTPITKVSAAGPLESYFNQLQVLASLQVCAAYQATIIDPDTRERGERLYLFARTLTEPTTFYSRTLEPIYGWGPWQKVDVSIGVGLVAPVYAFNRIFLFWLEPDLGQSASIEKQESKTETIRRAVLRFSFLSASGRWIQPQSVSADVISRAFPNNYSSLDGELKALLDPDNLSWRMPYVLSSGVGFTGAGRVSVSKDLKGVVGVETQFDREVHDGDQIWCAGEIRTVIVVAGSTNLGVDRAWTSSATAAEYRIIPKSQRARIEPFVGPGTVSASTVTPTVIGQGTQFQTSFSPGDKIAVGDQTQVVTFVASDTQLLVADKWSAPATASAYTVIPTKTAAERLIVFLGSPLKTDKDRHFDEPPKVDNPGLNMFLGQRGAFNQAMFSSLNAARQAAEAQVTGDVTMGSAFVLDHNLVKSSTLLVLPDYLFAAKGNPRPYRAVLDRVQEQLTVLPGQSALADNYWSESVAGVPDTLKQRVTAPFHNLLYYVSDERSSLLNVTNQPGWYVFNNGDEAFLVQSQEPNLNRLSDMVFVSPMPQAEMPSNTRISAGPHTPTPQPFDQLKFRFTRLTTSVVSALGQRLLAGGVDNLLTIESQSLPELPFNRFYPPPGKVPPPHTIPPAADKLDFDGAFGAYFEEIFFHAPFLIAHMLRSDRRFEDAKAWLEHIFNPTQQVGPDDPPDARRFWQYLPFRTMNQQSLLQILTDKRQITAYNDRPFDPDVIARLRPVAYAKAVVMRYIDNLLDWGDLLFTRDTRESINEATNLYVMASQLLGPRPRAVGRKPSPAPLDFRKIREGYPSGIPQFVIDLENSKFSVWNVDEVELQEVPTNDVRSYFCVPENSELTRYWDRVEDRLFKIRHCMDISGMVRSLALFEPPIDPRALIRALASGGGLPSLAGQLRPAIPFYRFDYMLEKAKEFAGTLQGFASAVQSAHEAKSAEELERLRVRQERRILDLTTKTLQQEIQDATSSGKALKITLEGAQFRKTRTDGLLKAGLLPNELMHLFSMPVAALLQTLAGISNTAAAINYSLPQVGSPFALTYGGKQLGNTLTAVAGALEAGANIATFAGEMSSTVAGYERRRQDWELELKQAQLDEKQATEELAAADARKQVAEQQLAIHLETIRQNEEQERFLREKFTSVELYQWLLNRTSTLYFQLYSISYDVALAAQQAFQYEFGTDQVFLEFGYWNDRAAGLSAADGLMLSLMQMDKARLSRPSRSLEIQRPFSLAAIDPAELLRLRREGACTIRLSEKLFDFDFPGHYARRIKSVSVTLEAEEGTFSGVSGTLVQTSNYIVMKSDSAGLNAVNFLLGGADATTPEAGAIRSNWWPRQQIALSTGTEDSGLFEVDLQSTGYLPFEGTGAVSTWELVLPPGANRFDFGAISDVTLQVQYTALDGGAPFRGSVLKLPALQPFQGGRFVDAALEDADAWNKFMEDHSSKEKQVLTLELDEVSPPNVRSARVSRLAVALSAASAAPGTYIKLALTDELTLDVELDSKNLFSLDFKERGMEEPLVEDVLGSRKLTFLLGKTPLALKDGDGFLDPDKLRDLQLILFYDGDVTL